MKNKITLIIKKTRVEEDQKHNPQTDWKKKKKCTTLSAKKNSTYHYYYY